MDQNISEMNYKELVDYAKSLGVQLNGTRKAGYVRDAIESHLKQVEEEKAKEAVETQKISAKPSKIKKSKNALAQEIRQTPRRAAKTKSSIEALASTSEQTTLQQEQSTEEKAVKKVKKSSKKVKETKREEEEATTTSNSNAKATVEIDLESTQPKRVKKSKKTSEIEQEIMEPEIKKKKVKKIEKKKEDRSEEKVESIGNIDDKAPDNTEKVKRGKKKVVKESNEIDQLDAVKPKSSKKVNKTATEEKKVKKIKKKKEPSPLAIVNAPIEDTPKPILENKGEQIVSPAIQSQQQLKNTRRSWKKTISSPRDEEFQLKLDADEDEKVENIAKDYDIIQQEEIKHLTELANEPHHVSSAFASNMNENASIITNDEDESMRDSRKTRSMNGTLNKTTPSRLNAVTPKRKSTRQSILNNMFDSDNQSIELTSAQVKIAEVNIQTESNDPIVDDDDDANITKDIRNETFDKSKDPIDNHSAAVNGSQQQHNQLSQSQPVTCMQFYSVKSPSPPQRTNAAQTAVESLKATQETEQPQPVEKPKGARIVRPKQILSSAITSYQTEPQAQQDEEESSQTKKLVEVIKREAGPRIVKPAESTVSGEPDDKLSADKRKLTEKSKNSKGEKIAQSTETENVPSKKLKSLDKLKKKEAANDKSNKEEAVSSNPVTSVKKNKIPNFKSIHAKAESKMESIKQFADRLVDRHHENVVTQAKASLPSASKQTSSAANEIVGESSKIADNLKHEKLKTPGSASRFKSKLMSHFSKKTPLKSSMSTSTVVSSNIPRFSSISNNLKNVELEETKKINPAIDLLADQQPSTPKNNPERRASLAKTPSSSKINSFGSSILKSAQKAFKFGSYNVSENQPVTAANLGSAFSRRKSYDLNLRNALQANTKVKPVDFTAKASFLSSLAAVTNENSVKVNEKPVDAAAARRISTCRPAVATLGAIDTNGSHVIKDLITNQHKAQLLSKKNSESKMNAIKSRNEKVKQQKDTNLDKTRNIRVNDENAA